MAEKKNSGIDSLLDALRQSGVNFERGSNPFGAEETGYAKGSNDASGSAASGTGGSAGKGKRSAGKGAGGFGGSGKGDFDFSFLDSISSWGRRALLISAIVIVLVGLAAYWWFHPPINIHSTDTWYFVAIFVLLPLFLVLFSRSRAYRSGTKKLVRNEGKAKRFKWLSFVPVAVVVIGVLGAIGSLAFFPGNAEKYSNIMVPDQLGFAEDIKEVNYSEIPIIDHDSAEILGNRAMGSIPEYVSQFEIESLYSQINYQNTPVRVSPLGYADIFKWWANREQGIPAYALVDMTTQDAEIVRLGEASIHYSQSEPLMRNIDRHVQLSFPFYMFDQKSFEIDDEGHAWWICPVKDFTIGLFGGQTISRVVLCDATTGECTDLSIEECPEWVDRAYPSELLIEQYNWHGAYSSGWINSWLGQSGVVQTTPGTNGMLGYNYIVKDDDVWMYSGVTSATADSSIVGFLLVNQRTAESHYYSVSGATEDSAMVSAEGQVQHLGYDATFPILINISNQPTYFMALKDEGGYVKMFAMLDIQHPQNVAVGDTVATTQEAYIQLLATTNVIEEGDSEVSTTFETTSGVIELMTQAVIDGNTHFYIRLEGNERIYDFALPGLLDVVAYTVGDSISFKYIAGSTMDVAQEITSKSVPTDVSQAKNSDSQKAADGEKLADTQDAADDTKAAGDEKPADDAAKADDTKAAGDEKPESEEAR